MKEVDEEFPFVEIYDSSKENLLFKLQINKRTCAFVQDEFIVEDIVHLKDLCPDKSKYKDYMK